MEYNKSYLLVQSLRAQGMSYREIGKNLGIGKSTVGRLANNNFITVREKTEKKAVKNFDKNLSNTQKGNQAAGLYLFFKNKRNKYDIMRVSKRIKKEGLNQKEIMKLYIQSIKGRGVKPDKEEDITFYEILKEGWIEIVE